MVLEDRVVRGVRTSGEGRDELNDGVPRVFRVVALWVLFAAAANYSHDKSGAGDECWGEVREAFKNKKHTRPQDQRGDIIEKHDVKLSQTSSPL